MRGIRILCVGKVREAFFAEGIDCYLREIRKMFPVEIVECPDEPTPDGASAAFEARIREKEGERLLARIRDDDYVTALCIEGRHVSSEKWRERLLRTIPHVGGSLVFVIGGSLGLSPAVVRRADEKLSFSAMTFPHQMMRMILCEQLAAALVRQ